MARRHSILIDEVPADLKATMNRLCALTDALYKKRETKGSVSKTERRDWDQLLDYMFHVEVLHDGRARDEECDTDPLALLNVAEKFNLAAPAQIAALRGTFNSQLEKIVGKELSPRQVAQLHKLLTQFNPAKPA